MAPWPWGKTTAIHKAVASGDVAKLKQLASRKGANVNAENAIGATALHLAAAQGEWMALQVLLAHPTSDPNVQESKGKTPLHLAISIGCRDTVCLLLKDRRTNVNLTDHEGRSPLHYAVEARGQLISDPHDILRLVVKARGVDYRTLDKRQRTALSWALELGFDDMVKCLISGREPVPEVAVTDAEGDTALHKAIRRSCSVVDQLVKGQDKGVVNAKDRSGETPVHVAARSNLDSFLNPLVDAGADLDGRRNSDGATPFHIAVQHGSYEFVEHLLKRLKSHGPPPRKTVFAQDDHGDTPLHLAAGRGDARMVGAILDFSQVVNEEIVWGSKPAPFPVLHPVLGPCSIDLVKVNNKNEAPVDLAARHGHFDVAIRLLQAEKIESDEARSARCETVRQILPRLLADEPEGGSAHAGGAVPVCTPDSEPVPPTTHPPPTTHQERLIQLAEWAARENPVEVPESLRHHVDPTTHQERLIQLAEWAAREDLVEVLESLRHHVDSSTLDRCIVIAARGGAAHAVRYLVEEAGIGPNCCPPYLAPPLAVAAQYGNTGVMEFLLSLEVVNPNLRRAYGGPTPLMCAIQARSAAAVALLLSDEIIGSGRLLLDKGDETMEQRGGKGKQTERWRSNPLLLASKLGYDDMVGMLLQPNVAAKITLGLQDSNGHTALSLACQEGHWRVVELLLQAHSQTATPASNLADVDVVDDRGASPFAHACASTSSETVALFLSSDLFKQKVVDPNSRSGSGRTPLAHACFNGRTNIVKQILGSYLITDRLVDPDARDNLGRGPLAWACWKGHWEIVDIFLDCFLSGDNRGLVDFCAVDREGANLLCLAARGKARGSTRTVLTLLDERLVLGGFVDTEQACRLMGDRMRDYHLKKLQDSDMPGLIARFKYLGFWWPYAGRF